MKKDTIFVKEEEKLAKIDLSEDSGFSRTYFELEKKFNKKVYDLYQKAEKKKREAEARYGDPVINF